MAALVVTFDAGQTLVELDLDFLAARLAGRGVEATVSALVAAAPAAWRRYEAQTEAGEGHPWRALMTTLLRGAGIAPVDELVAWLWAEQPRHNLWRRPIPDMVALARELAARGVRVAVVSNSEGRLAELLDEIGIADAFAAVIDSGKLGIEKPDPRIFAHAREAVGAPGDARCVHIGDSWGADVVGARAAGWDAVWYGAPTGPADPRVAVARDAAEVRAALTKFGI